MAAAREGLDQVGVGEVAHRRPTEMSGGQAQRVALARALVTSPRILFADEPTGALDRSAGQVVLEAIREASRRDGTTLVLVTHDPAVAEFADREVHIADGQDRVAHRG